MLDESCVFWASCIDGIDECKCRHYRPITNADRIRAMGDIELGNFLSGLILGCSDCPMYEECDGVDCNSRWQKWLKEEADDDNYDH